MTMAGTSQCPSCGAASTTADYCDTCGAAIAGAAGPPDPGSPPAADPTATLPSGGTTPAGVAPGPTCPSCGAARTPDDAFCEVCGLDFATGKMPAAPGPPAAAPAAAPTGAPSGWTAGVDADRSWFDSNQAETPGAIQFPDGLGSRQIPLTGDEVVVGRRSETKGFFPGIDLSSPVADPAVSHRHAVLRRQLDGSWALVDEMSTNGTWLNGADAPLDHGMLTALHDGDTIHLGAFSRITIRKDKDAPAS